ncbi:MAG: SRPBCC family protein [Alphaproteobacteria bacterium]|nr:SRPBCC family protein [Alphaproteobacteria bacterium]
MLTALVIIAILIAALLAIAASRPNTFSLSRSTTIDAAPEKVFAQINDFKNWVNWSPWEKLDATMQKTFSGAASGKGAKYSWVGNKKVGEGAMEITNAQANSNVTLDLHFYKPFKADNVTEFTITPQGAGSKVNWEMRGNLNLFMKLMHMFMNMDRMVGKDFEAGLAAMKSTVEGK